MLGNEIALLQTQELEEMVSKMKNEKEKDLIVENRFHKQLIGPKGENIQKIRDEFSSVQISFPDLGVKSDIVKLRGPKDDVDLCSKTLNKMYKDLLESNYQVNRNLSNSYKGQISARYYAFNSEKMFLSLLLIAEIADLQTIPQVYHW